MNQAAYENDGTSASSAQLAVVCLRLFPFDSVSLKQAGKPWQTRAVPRLLAVIGSTGCAYGGEPAADA